MNFTQYQEQAHTTKNYPDSIALLYAALGLCGEAGEVANKIKKVYRDHGGDVTGDLNSAILDELGDVLWYVAALCDELDIDMGSVAARNLRKLATRAEKGIIHGDGDKR